MVHSPMHGLRHAEGNNTVSPIDSKYACLVFVFITAKSDYVAPIERVNQQEATS